MTLPVALIASGVGFSFAAVTAMAMECFPNSPGTTSAILTLLRGCLITIAISVAGFLYVDQAIEISYAIGSFCLISAAIYFAVTRKLPRSVSIET